MTCRARPVPEPDICGGCGVELAAGSGRYIVDERVLCIVCYDNARRSPR